MSLTLEDDDSISTEIRALTRFPPATPKQVDFSPDVVFFIGKRYYCICLARVKMEPRSCNVHAEIENNNCNNWIQFNVADLFSIVFDQEL